MPVNNLAYINSAKAHLSRFCGLYPEAKEMRELNQKKVQALKEQWGAAILMLSEEYKGAKQKLLSAQQLYPELDNISLMLTICDILLLASSVRLSYHKIDFNCILDLIYPSATYSDARYYLHDLATLINGIKGEFPGAELALEIVQNALNMVSEKEKHFHHGFRHDNGLISWEEILDGKSTASASTSENSSRDFPNPDVPLQQTGLKESLVEDQECQQQEFHNFEEERSVNLFEPGQIWAVHYQPDDVKQCPYAKINFKSGDVLSVVWLKPVPFGVDERMWCNAGLPIACGAFCLDPSTSHEVRTRIFSYKCSWLSGLMDDQIEIYPKRGEIWAVYKDGIFGEWTCNPEALKGSKFELIEMFSDYSKCAGGDFIPLEKVNGFCSVFKRLTCGRSPILFPISPNSLLFSHKIPAHTLLGGKDEVLFELDQMALPKSLIQDINISDSNSNISDNKLCVVKLQSEDKFLEHSISTYDFANGQVWAIYCGKDKMPRQYAVVNSVVSSRQVCVTLLEPELVLDYENRLRDLPVACGNFKAGNSNVILNISQFSHLVKYVHGTTRPHYMIYPHKGEIWAMYKNWNRKWGHADYEKCQCRIVEIISDFSKENGIRVAKLEEVHNCVTFFHRQQHEGFDLSSTLFEAEMLSFSHQILAYRVPGIESYGIPEDSWHLEPQAIPNQ